MLNGPLLTELLRDPNLYGKVNAQFRMLEMSYIDIGRIQLMEAWCADMFGVDPRFETPALPIERWSRMGKIWYFRYEVDAILFKMMWSS